MSEVAESERNRGHLVLQLLIVLSSVQPLQSSLYIVLKLWTLKHWS